LKYLSPRPRSCGVPGIVRDTDRQERETKTLEFDPEAQSALYDFGYQQALAGTARASRAVPTDDDELLELIVEPAWRFDAYEPAPWLRRGGDSDPAVTGEPDILR
jgi:hypothetical protein